MFMDMLYSFSTHPLTQKDKNKHFELNTSRLRQYYFFFVVTGV